MVQPNCSEDTIIPQSHFVTFGGVRLLIAIARAPLRRLLPNTSASSSPRAGRQHAMCAATGSTVSPTTDAVVNAANEGCLADGGVDGTVYDGSCQECAATCSMRRQAGAVFAA
jgi:hypothetical protein